MIESMYDEDLSENPFFQELNAEYKQLIDNATTEGWIVCIPRTGSFQRTTLSEDDFLCHILVPNEELPRSHYRTLNGKQVTVYNKVITIEDAKIVPSISTHIIFEETFYTHDLLKYKVWCIECLLNNNNRFQSNSTSDFNSVLTLRDCIDLLWTESLGKEILEQLDVAANSFLETNPYLEKCSLQTQKDLVNTLYAQCLKIALCDSRLREQTSKNKHLLNNLNVAIETFMQHNIYKKLFNSISVCTAYDDSSFNKIIRNLSDIQLRDLDIKLELYDTIPCAKRQLAKINGFSTILGKISCLKHTISEITQCSSKSEFNLSADDLLPVLVFLILKTGIPNWIANLVFLKQFQFSSLSTADESNFLVTTLEAAIEHIRSGILLGPSEPESHQNYDTQLNTPEKKFDDGYKNKISYLFEQVRLGNYEEVKDILEKSNKSKSSFDTNTKELCHPLCSCDKCERLLSQILCSTTPTVLSCDDRGYTSLHIACMYGKPKIVELLLEYDANMQSCDYSGASALHYAAMRGHQNALLLLLHSGADINAIDNEKNTPLHFSCNNGHDACVKAMLYFSEHQANTLNVNCVNVLGESPLHYAARWGYESIVNILLEYGADSFIENKYKKTPSDCAHNLNIYHIIMNGKLRCRNIEERITTIEANDDNKINLDFVEDTVKEQATKPRSTYEIKKAEKLLRAVAYGDVPMLCYYLGLPIPDSHRKITNDSFLLCHPLCTCEKCEMSQNSYEKTDYEKQDINVCNSEEYTALHIASLHGRTEIVNLLLSNGALPNVVTRKGLTALHLACQTQRHQIVRLLLECKGCNVNIQDVRGNTALHYASYSRDSRIIEELIGNKANINLRNANGKTVLDETEEKMLFGVVKILNDKNLLL